MGRMAWEGGNERRAASQETRLSSHRSGVRCARLGARRFRGGDERLGCLADRGLAAMLSRFVFVRSALRTALLALSLAILSGVAECIVVVSQTNAADLPVKAPPPSGYDWTGFHVGGHVGLAGGRETWSADSVAGGSPVAGSFGLYRPPDPFSQAGSFLEGVQLGYNYMLRNRVVLGVEADASFPAFPDLSGLTTGGRSEFVSANPDAGSFSETMLSSGTLRARIGYAPGHWLFYATGGLAWTFDRQELALAAGGNAEDRSLWRFGWAAGAGVEVPIAPSWTAKGEFLWTGYPNQSVAFPPFGQRTVSDVSVQQLRLGLNYRFDDPSSPAAFAPSRFVPPVDMFAVHGQATYVQQAYPAFRSPYQGPNSLTGSAQSKETFDLTLSTGVKLWQGAEFWANPEIDQGFGFDNTHGAAGFPSAESYKLGSSTPYARVQRAFLRQTINLGGETEQVDEDFYQFKGTRSSDRIVLTVGRFGIIDIFDTNRYANNPKGDFLNWTLINAGTFDYAADGWGYTYGAAAEWYTGRWTLRAGVFDLSTTPADGISPSAFALDPTFQQFQMIFEIEERHDLWGQPGKVKLTGFLSRGAAGEFSEAVALAQITGGPADINAVRSYTSRPGISLNIEQQVTPTLGPSFAPAGLTARSSPGISPMSTVPSPAACRSTENRGAAPTTRSALPASSTASAMLTSRSSMRAASAS
jgi:high affinity Mn2+ porin